MADTETMLIVTQVAPYVDGPAGVHGTLTQATTALSELAGLAGLDPVTVADVRDLLPEELTGARVLALFTIGETPWSDEQKRAAHAAWGAGTLRVLGVHSATDASHTWPEYGTMLGARFDGHPWTQDFAIDVVEQNHPATAHLGGQLVWHDEVYLFKDFRPDAQILLRLAEDQVDLSAPGGRVPRLWISARLVRRRRSGPFLLHRARALPSRLGAAGLSPPPGRRARLARGPRLT